MTAAKVSFRPLNGFKALIISETFPAIASLDPKTRTPWKLAVLTAAAAASAAKSRTTTSCSAHTSSAMANTFSALKPFIGLA